jgi:hypothetical protein
MAVNATIAQHGLLNIDLDLNAGLDVEPPEGSMRDGVPGGKVVQAMHSSLQIQRWTFATNDNGPCKCRAW